MISTTGRSLSATATAGQTIFTFPNAVIDGDHLTAAIDGVATTAFTVIGAPSDTSVNVVFSTAMTGGEAVVITRTTPATQLVDYVANESFNAETHEDALDKLTLILQELLDDIDRAIKAPVGSTTITRFTTSDYGKYLKLQADGDIEGADGTTVTTTVDLGDLSDVDVATVAAAGTTTIAIPNTKTPIFGAIILAQAGAGAYTHNVDLPAPGSTGQRCFIRVYVDSSSTNPTIVIRDNGGTTIETMSTGSKAYKLDLCMVANGSSWVRQWTKWGDIGFDRYTAASYYPTTSTELATALSDANAVIYVNTQLTIGGVLDFGLDRELLSTQKMVIASGAGLDFNSQRGWHMAINGDLITAYEGQQIFFNCFPGSVTGTFNGATRSADWWYGSGEALSGYHDDWWAIQSAIYAGDWDGADNAGYTVTNWNDGTETITNADHTGFAEGDKVELYNAALPAYLTTTRPYLVINGTNGAGNNISTYQLGLFLNHRPTTVADNSPVTWGSGGSLSAKVRKTTCQTNHLVKLHKRSWTIGLPLDFAGTGCYLDLNGATITATEQPDSVGSAWWSHMFQSEAIADGSGQAFTKTDYVSGPNLTDITITNHGYVDGDIVWFSALTTAGNLGLDEGYYVNQIDTNTFRLRRASTGSDIDLGGNVAGTVYSKGGGAPMIKLGGTGGESNTWRGLPQRVFNGFLSGGGVPGVTIFGANGTIPRRTKLENLQCSLATRHFLGWARDWDALPGKAASNDFSSIILENFYYATSQKHGGTWPVPFHTPGVDVVVRRGEVQGNTLLSGDVPYIWYGASPRSLTIEGIEYQDSPIFLKFANNGLYLNATLRSVTEQAGSNEDATSCTSVDTGTEFITSTAHPFANNDRVAFEGTGTLPTGMSADTVYFIKGATTNTFQVSLTIGGAAVNLTADNGAFTLHKVGTIVEFASSQSTAHLQAYDIGTMDDSLLAYDATVNTNFTNGIYSSSNSIVANRRAGMVRITANSYDEY